VSTLITDLILNTSRTLNATNHLVQINCCLVCFYDNYEIINRLLDQVIYSGIFKG